MRPRGTRLLEPPAFVEHARGQSAHPRRQAATAASVKIPPFHRTGPFAMPEITSDIDTISVV
ncbi:hypothetical protein, partial [Burkholderia pseudomallei]|uniref:hypothetical protein n=1 Tax=Burkholderia pseudomallei TaxID=28450 RepID=UPI001CC27B29